MLGCTPARQNPSELDTWKPACATGSGAMITVTKNVKAGIFMNEKVWRDAARYFAGRFTSTVRLPVIVIGCCHVRFSSTQAFSV